MGDNTPAAINVRKRSSLHRDRCLCGAAYVCAFLLLAAALVHHPGFPLDDSWIHQVIARNFAQYHRLGFTPGQLTAGSTSLLWSALFALYWTVFPHLSPVVANAVTSVVILFGIGYELKALTEEDALPAVVSWCLALAPLASGNFLWFGMIGMEHLLFILLSLLLLRRWFTEPLVESCFEGAGLQPRRQKLTRHWGFSPGGNGDLLLLGLFTCLLVLTRPEGLFLGVILLLTVRHARRTLTALLAAFAGGALALAVITGTNWAIGHRLVPQTMQGRQFLYRLSRQGFWSARRDFLNEIAVRCLKIWSFFGTRRLTHGHTAWVGALLLAALFALLFLGLFALKQLAARRSLSLAAWGLLLFELYFFLLPSPGHGGRYISLPLMLFLPLVCIGALRICAIAGLRPRHAALLVAMFAGITAARSISLWQRATVAQVAQIEGEHGAMAAWLQQNLHAAVQQSQVGVFDIGRIGYALNGHIVDLGGLVDPTFLRFVAQHRIAEYLAHRSVQYVVLPSGAQDDSVDFRGLLGLQDSPQLRLQPLHSICIDPAVDALAEISGGTAYPCQRAYRLILASEAQP